jgi:hypothetical protein
VLSRRFGTAAAVNSKVAIGNVANSATAIVTPQNQLLTTTIDPSHMFSFVGNTAGPNCHTLYTPPADKPLMLTNVTFYLSHVGGGSYAEVILQDRTCGKDYES